MANGSGSLCGASSKVAISRTRLPDVFHRDRNSRGSNFSLASSLCIACEPREAVVLHWLPCFVDLGNRLECIADTDSTGDVETHLNRGVAVLSIGQKSTEIYSVGGTMKAAGKKILELSIKWQA